MVLSTGNSLANHTRKVKDLVSSLVALKPEDHGNSTALKIAAGSYTTSSRMTNA